tara:strand:- start:15008 stop:15436 length:429 start_codon:yes stop_codon:yes gene_type:complete
MGKGGADPYPLSFNYQPTNGTAEERSRSRRKRSVIYHADSVKEKERRDRNEYYREKSWSQRESERKEQFKKDFMNASHFDPSSTAIEKSMDLFKIKKSSSEEDFKKQYRKLILKHHPDKGGDNSFFIKIQEAYENIQNYFAS